MQWWMLGAASNGVIAVAYFMISFAITRGLLKSGQLSTNRLGAATAAIFLSCAVHHGAHMVHMLMPYAGADLTQGLAMRAAWGPQLAFWDLVSAFVGVYYWTLREASAASARLEPPALRGPARARAAGAGAQRRRAAGHGGGPDGPRPRRGARALRALDGSIAAASTMITDLIGDDRGHLANRPLRSAPALVPERRA